MTTTIPILNDCQRSTLACVEGVHCAFCRNDATLRRQAAQLCGGQAKACPRGYELAGEDESFPPRAAGSSVGRAVHATPANPSAFTTQVTPQQAGPGSLLSRMIREATGIDSAGCASCDGRVRQMNQWGWTGCIAHARTIYGWLRDECKTRGITPDRRMIWKAIKGALRKPESGTSKLMSENVEK